MPRRNLAIIFLTALVSVACYHRAARNRYVATLTDVMNVVGAQYVDEVEPRVLFEGAMKGMISQLDPYSGYVNPEEYRDLLTSLDQVFSGVGVEVEINPETQRLTIMTPLVGSPAHKAGLQSGDQILEIDGNDTAGMTIENSKKLIRGEEGTTVQLKVLRPSAPQPLTVNLTRSKIPIESVLGDVRRKDGSWVYHLQDHPQIGYIRLTNFGKDTADELRQALDGFREPGKHIEALILDLRRNPGGLLEAAVQSCDQFLDGGVIVTTRGRGGVERAAFHAEPGVELGKDVPMVVLVDKYSASASEIVAACLQDHGRAVVVGQRSWGKGTVQNVLPLENNKSALRLTIASYWRPSGIDIHKRKDAKESDEWGVTPDAGMTVDLTDEQFARVVRERRARDLKAVEGEATSNPSLPMPPPDVDPGASVGSATPAPTAVQGDPQLQQAIEYLDAQINKRSGKAGGD